MISNTEGLRENQKGNKTPSFLMRGLGSRPANSRLLEHGGPPCTVPGVCAGTTPQLVQEWGPPRRAASPARKH